MLIPTLLSNMPCDQLDLTRVIIVDTLDKCKQEECYILQILTFFLELDTVCLRVFVTSRSTTLIVNPFKGLKEKCILYRYLLLNNKEFDKEMKKDIVEDKGGVQSRCTVVESQTEETTQQWRSWQGKKDGEGNAGQLYCLNRKRKQAALMA